jgi:hypothetical protein
MIGLIGRQRSVLAVAALLVGGPATSQVPLQHLYDLMNVESRSVSAENPTGEKGAGGGATEGFGKDAAKHLGRG